MAVTNTRSLFLMRLAGLTGLMLLVTGLVLWLVIGIMAIGLVITVIGAALFFPVETWILVKSVVHRRRGLEAHVAAQIALVLALLVGFNVFSFFHYQRFDWTSDQLFTINSTIRQQLEQLRGETDIVVYLRFTSSLGQAVDNRLAHFQAAAQRKIIEKVKDLAEEFQELGPRFRVEVLNIQDEDFEPKLKEIKKKAPALAEAIDKAPENSIFFFSQGRVQRLGFNDIYQLDSTASLEANHQKGNLVLQYQGVGPFANKILNIEEKKPRIGVAVVHELLSLEDPQDPRLTMAGAKKVLTSYGFATSDVILKKWPGAEPTVFTFDESRYEGLEEQRLELEATVKENGEEIQVLDNKMKVWKNSSLADLKKKVAVVLLPGRAQPIMIEQEHLEALKKAGRDFKVLPVEFDEEDRAEVVRDLETKLGFLQLSVGQAKKELAAVVKEQKDLNIDNLAEQRRLTDLGAKMNRWLGDIDLLILPRMTFLDIPRRDIIINRAHKLDDSQLEAIKDFMKKGKPVLFCLGPSNEPKRDLEMPDFGGGADPLESMLTSLGFQLPKQTILFNVESKSFAERRGNLIIQGTQVEVPPVEFDWKAGAGLPGQVLASRKEFASTEPRDHPIRTSLRLAGRSVGKGEAMDLRLRHPRPVYFLPAKGRKNIDPVLMMATAESWNEDDPLNRERTPRFELPKKDPREGTPEEKRRGPFPIAAAAEADLPASWFDKSDRGPHKDRVVVLGHGGVFVGPTLTQVREKLLLDTCNWLLGRDDLLAKNNEVWEYPRVELSETQKDLWHWATFLGIPMLFVYTGLLVFMVRRMR